METEVDNTPADPAADNTHPPVAVVGTGTGCYSPLEGLLRAVYSNHQ